MAGALGIALSGPRVYPEGIANEPYLNADGRRAEPNDIRRSLRVYAAACTLEIVVYATLALLI